MRALTLREDIQKFQDEAIRWVIDMVIKALRIKTELGMVSESSSYIKDHISLLVECSI